MLTDMRTALSLMLVVVVGLVATGCGHLAVGPASPRPNVIVAPEKAPVSLVLAPTVPDDFVIPDSGSVNEVPVKSWRQTLTAGFQSAFPRGGVGRRLEILQAELSFGPAAVGRGGTAAVIAQIRFKARLFDETGNEIGALAGTSHAREANVSASEAGMTDNATKAVESLYEVLATELIAKI